MSVAVRTVGDCLCLKKETARDRSSDGWVFEGRSKVSLKGFLIAHWPLATPDLFKKFIVEPQKIFPFRSREAQKSHVSASRFSTF
jgi:hypothetical protein